MKVGLVYALAFFTLFFNLNLLLLHFLHLDGFFPAPTLFFALHLMQIQTLLKSLSIASLVAIIRHPINHFILSN